MDQRHWEHYSEKRLKRHDSVLPVVGRAAGLICGIGEGQKDLNSADNSRVFNNNGLACAGSSQKIAKCWKSNTQQLSMGQLDQGLPVPRTWHSI